VGVGGPGREASACGQAEQGGLSSACGWASGRASVGVVEHGRRRAASGRSRLPLSPGDGAGRFQETAVAATATTAPCPSGVARLLNRGAVERPGWLSAIWSQARCGSCSHILLVRRLDSP
jgi:hypothetical protein